MKICNTDMCSSIHPLSRNGNKDLHFTVVLFREEQCTSYISCTVCSIIAPLYMYSLLAYICSLYLVWIISWCYVNIVHFLLVIQNHRFNKKPIKIVVYVTTIIWQYPCLLMNVQAVFFNPACGKNVRSVARSNRKVVATAPWKGRKKCDVL